MITVPVVASINTVLVISACKPDTATLPTVLDIVTLFDTSAFNADIDTEHTEAETVVPADTVALIPVTATTPAVQLIELS